MVDSGGYLSRPSPSGLADVVETILDRGIVIDAYVRVSLLGIELLTVDARIVVASVDTFLRFAEATNRLDLDEHGGRTLPDILAEGTERAVTAVASDVVEHKVDRGLESVGDAVEAAAGKAADVADRMADAISPGDSDEPQ
jgi:gas vesicle structural protein